MKKALLSATAALTVSCGILGILPHTTWLEVSAGANYADDIFEIEWPIESGEYVTVNQSLRDPGGLAGIEVEVRVPGQPPHELTAIHFRGRLNNTFDEIEVPEAGTVNVFVKLYQNGELVAGGHISWVLDSGVDRWRLAVERVPQAFGVAIYEDDPTPRCHFPWCYQIERIEIDEAARNYPAEALWLVLDKNLVGGW